MTADTILFETRGAVAIATLNRPQALNALDLGMIRSFAPQLRQWQNDPAVHAVILRGNGDKAFCAGGDVRMAWDAIKAARAGDKNALQATRDYFREEYRLDAQLKHYPKPIVALIDGITMGGGVGLSVHGQFCVATERTVWAMPEMAIGFIPDVGSSYILARLPSRIGMYLALTGARIGDDDCLPLALATHTVPSADLDRLVETLAALPKADRAAIARALEDFHFDPGPPALALYAKQIDACFGQPTVEGIFAALTKDNSAWARETLQMLGKLSPTSLKIAHRQLQEAHGLEFEDCLRLEYRLSQACMAEHDFFEGVRAILVDKDRKPRWWPGALEEITPEIVEKHFAFPAETLTFGT